MESNYWKVALNSHAPQHTSNGRESSVWGWGGLLALSPPTHHMHLPPSASHNLCLSHTPQFLAYISQCKQCRYAISTVYVSVWWVNLATQTTQRRHSLAIFDYKILVCIFSYLDACHSPNLACIFRNIYLAPLYSLKSSDKKEEP